jgi:hypothetical protein
MVSIGSSSLPRGCGVGIPSRSELPPSDRHVDQHERRISERQTRQFQILKDEAHALFGMLNGPPGVTWLAKLEKLVKKAGDEIGSGT